MIVYNFRVLLILGGGTSQLQVRSAQCPDRQHLSGLHCAALHTEATQVHPANIPPVATVHRAGWPPAWQQQDLCQQGAPQLAQSMVTVNSSDASEQTSGMPEACSAQVSRQPGLPPLQWPPRWDQQPAQQGALHPQAAPGMPRSSSAPDVRLLVNTHSLPGPRNLLQPSSGNPLAGALVPYKGPEVGGSARLCMCVYVLQATPRPWQGKLIPVSLLGSTVLHERPVSLWADRLHLSRAPQVEPSGRPALPTTPLSGAPAPCRATCCISCNSLSITSPSLHVRCAMRLA